MKKFGNFYSEVRLDEISDRANIDIDWDFGADNGTSESSAKFNAGGEGFNVELSESNPGYFTVTFQNSGGYSQTGKQGHGAAAVFSGVLTCLREFTERYEEEMAMKPYEFDFSAAYELPRTHEHYKNISSHAGRNELFKLPLDEQKRLLKDFISRPMLYYSLSLSFGKEQGYSTHMNDRLLRHLCGNADDFRSVRKNATRTIAAMDEQAVANAFAQASGSVSFTLTNDHQRSSDYDTPFGEANLEDAIEDAGEEQVQAWINDGREDDILEYADWQKLVQIASWGLMHDELIKHDDEDVRYAVVSSDYEMGETLGTSDEWEHRKQAAEMGFLTHQLAHDADDDVREAAWDYAREAFDSEELISMAKGVARNIGEESTHDLWDYMIDWGDDEQKIYVAQEGYRIDELMSDNSSDVREAAMAQAFDQYGTNEAVDFIMSHSADERQDNFEWIMSQSYGPSAEEYALEQAKENGLDVDEYEDDGDEEPGVTDYTVTPKGDTNTSKLQLDFTDSDGDDQELTIERDHDPKGYRVIDDSGTSDFSYAWEVFTYLEQEHGLLITSNSDFVDFMKY